MQKGDSISAITKIYHLSCRMYTQCSVASWRDDYNFTSGTILFIKPVDSGQESSLEQCQWNIELCFLNGWLRSSPQGCNLSFIAYLNYSQVTGIQSSNTETLQVWSCRAKIVSKWSGKWCKMPVLYTFSRSMLSQYSYLTVVAMLIDWTVIVCLQWCCI